MSVTAASPACLPVPSRRPEASLWRALLGLALLLSAAACASPSNKPGEFQAWLAGLRREALAQQIAPATLDEALGGVSPLPRVIELDRQQPEFKLSFAQYLERVVPERRVALGKQKLEADRKLLETIGTTYGVQPRFLVALWGIETDFGRLTGGFRVIDALATLAYDGRRSAFFRTELLDALHILDEGHTTPERMTGSWAGAMGQVQFMPSSFRRFAVDENGDGHRDIWNTEADALASAANYLARSGWHGDQTWGREVRLPPGFDPALVGRDTVKPLSQWQALGVRRANGADLPTRDLPASIIEPGGPDGPAYAVYDNFRTLLKWNRSDFFATAVGILADRLASR